MKTRPCNPSEIFLAFQVLAEAINARPSINVQELSPRQREQAGQMGTIARSSDTGEWWMHVLAFGVGGGVEFRLPVRRLSWSASDDQVVGLCGVKSVCVYACGSARGLQGVRLS
jgi:hypothetical protein